MAEDYALLRGSEQVIRVNVNQYVWRETLGYLLHPSIPQSVSKVADVATATGLWLCVLDESRPGLEVLDGYDISGKSFLSTRDRPAKINLEALDASQPCPDALKGKYDVVHVRLVLPGVYTEEPTAIINHCKDLLRPGGYLQWEEFDVLDYDVQLQPGVPQPSNLELAVNTFQKGVPKTWIPKLGEVLEKNGMKHIATDRKREPIWHRTTMTHLVCGVLGEISRARLDVKGPPGAGDKLRATLAAALDENLAGSYVSSRFQCVVAQKPE